jgi:uncharacterized protein (TIGR03435 family)
MPLLPQSRGGALARVRFAFASRSLVGFALLALAAAAQNSVRFEVFSIRPISGTSLSMNTAPSPNGFDSRLSLWQAIMVAYGPDNYVNWGSVEILKAPGWIGEFYDIRARISQADLKAWQNQSKAHELLRSALQAALKDRCKLAIHEQPSKAEIFELGIGRRGPQLKASAPNATPPSGVKLAGGGVMVQTVVSGKQVKTFHGATMQDLADFLCIMAGRTPVRDRTGLTGRYDFTIQQVEQSPDENHVYSYPVEPLGLQIKLGAESRPALVIDHIEKPTAN